MAPIRSRRASRRPRALRRFWRPTPARRFYERAIHRTNGGSTARLREYAEPRRTGLSRKHREWVAGYLFLLPDLLGLLLFLGIPMLLALSLGFFEVDGFGHYTWIGLDNYRAMVHDDLFIKVSASPSPMSSLLVPGLFITGHGAGAARQAAAAADDDFSRHDLSPNVISLVVVGLVWQFMLVDRSGMVNRSLVRLGLGAIVARRSRSGALDALVAI